MKSKKWIIIGCISLALIITELLLLFLVVMPGMGKTKALKAMLDGDKSVVKDEFMSMDADKTASLKESVRDIVVYQTNQYLDGKIDYTKFFNTMECVESVAAYSGMTADAFPVVNISKMKTIYEDAVKAYVKDKNGSEYKAKKTEFTNYRRCRLTEDGDELIYSWSREERKAYEKKYVDELDAVLKTKYTSYEAGNVTYDDMDAAVDVAQSFWSSDYTYDLNSLMRDERYISEAYDQAKKYFDEQEYWSVLRYIENTKEYYSGKEAWKKWEERFNTLDSETREKAKTYYTEQAIKAAKDGDTYSAERIISEMKKYLGDDVDTSKIIDSMHADWQKAYVEFMNNWDATLREDVKKETKLSDQLDDLAVTNYDSNVPTKMFLYDFDDNQVPELLLAGNGILYIYTYYNNKVEYTGFVYWIGLGEKPTIIMACDVKADDGITGNIEAVISFSGKDWTVNECCVIGKKDKKTAYGVGTNTDNLETVEKDVYTAKKKEIEGKIKTRSLTSGAMIKDYENFIYSYK